MASSVSITKNEDGTFTVTDSSAEEGAEGGMTGGQMMQGGQGGMEGMQGEMAPEGQQVATLKDALMAAADILTNGGSTDMESKQAAFNSADERLTR